MRFGVHRCRWWFVEVPVNEQFETVILSACRTPIGAFGGVFKDLTAVDLGAVVIREAIVRAGVKPADVHAVGAIGVGYVDTIVAGGTESMSNAPYLLKGARWGYRMGHADVVDSMLLEGLTCAINSCHIRLTISDV